MNSWSTKSKLSFSMVTFFQKNKINVFHVIFLWKYTFASSNYKKYDKLPFRTKLDTHTTASLNRNNQLFKHFSTCNSQTWYSTEMLLSSWYLSLICTTSIRTIIEIYLNYCHFRTVFPGNYSCYCPAFFSILTYFLYIGIIFMLLSRKLCYCPANFVIVPQIFL